MYYVYILQSQKDKSFYIGFTENVKERVKQHNQHTGVYSSKKAPFILKWFACFSNEKKAYEFEKYLKSSSGFAFRNKHLL